MVSMRHVTGTHMSTLSHHLYARIFAESLLVHRMLASGLNQPQAFISHRVCQPGGRCARIRSAECFSAHANERRGGLWCLLQHGSSCHVLHRFESICCSGELFRVGTKCRECKRRHLRSAANAFDHCCMFSCMRQHAAAKLLRR